MMTQTTEEANVGESEASSRASTITLSLLDTVFGGSARHDFAVRLWNGENLPAKNRREPRFTLVLSHPGALRRMLFPPGELTLAEAYLRGDFDIDGDVFAVMSLASRFESLSIGKWLSLVRQVLSLPASEPPIIHQDGR